MSIENHEDITGKRLLRDIEWATSGDHDAAYRLFEVFELAVHMGEPVPQELLRYFADCFLKIRDGCDLRVALNVKTPRHRPPDRAMWLRDVRLVIAFEELRLNAKTVEEAITEVAAQYCVSESTVRRAYLAYDMDNFGKGK